jgi:hypothetical protein
VVFVIFAFIKSSWKVTQMKKILLTLSVLLIVAFSSVAQESISGCARSQSQIDLDIGNVRARILRAGDMWWDFVNDAQYEVPKGSGKHSLFAGALWMGGIDAGNNLHVAAQTYRQAGDDFWPGPLDTTTADISAATCSQHDKFWKINRQDVVDFIAGNPATADMMSYPGNGTGAQAHFLAPFFDNNGDGLYNTGDGDYPQFDYIGSMTSNCNNALHGDQAIWFVINDAGNTHTETAGAAFGVEIQIQAFAYNCSDEDIANATFYQYKLINRNTVNVYDSVFVGAWVDTDLGNALDDFVGCDVRRGMGYSYNGDNYDESIIGYGWNPPAIGFDYVQGPTADASDGIDNDRDSVIDEVDEQIIMTKFVYYDGFGPHDNPNYAPEYYTYLKGLWMDSTVITYGGNGYGGGVCATNTPCSFFFPGDSDPYGWGTNGVITQTSPCWNWDETAAGNSPSDRRFLMSAGPFTLIPGAVQYFTTSAVWARAQIGGALASLAKLKLVDDKIQTLADGCWNIAPFIFSLDAGITTIVSPADTICDTTFSPIVRIKNYGNTILTSATINYRVDGNPIQTFLWTGSLPTMATDDVILAPISAPFGQHTLTVYTTNPNSSSDQNVFNDSSIVSFIIPIGVFLPVTQGFESLGWPPSGWSIIPTGSPLNLLRQTVGGFGNSTYSLRAYCYSQAGRSNNFISPYLDMNSVFVPAYLTFSIAYAERTDSSADTLQIYASTDCGQTYTLLYSKTDTVLATASNHSTSFIPLASEWRTDSIDLSAFVGQRNLKIKFHFQSGDALHPGNNIYVDDINITGIPTGINTLFAENQITIFPNPMHNSFTISVNDLSSMVNSQLTIFDVIGREVYQQSLTNQSTIIDKKFSTGIYFVKVRIGEKGFTEKLVVE